MQLDPEDMPEIVTAYHRAVAATVASFDTFVAKTWATAVVELDFAAISVQRSNRACTVRVGFD